MPWSESRMQDRSRFIEAWQTQTWSVIELCRRFEVSRKTAYKVIERYKRFGAEGLADRSRARLTQAHRTSAEVEGIIVKLAEDRRAWGPRKLRACLMMKHPEKQWPAVSTIGDLLKRYGLTKPRRRHCNGISSTPSRFVAEQPNDLWRIDFKGWALSGDKKRCEPLGVTDHVTRFAITCDLLPNNRTEGVSMALEPAMKEYGLPLAILSDNGPPFAMSYALAGLSKLAVRWLRLGIRLLRIDPGKPTQNGGHERFNLTMLREAMTPMESTREAQAQRLREFRRIYNEERPHEALGDKPPSSVYVRSPRPFPEEIPPFTYSPAFIPRTVTNKGIVKVRGNTVYLSEALCGESVGLEYIGSSHWCIHLGPLEVALYDEISKRVLRYDTLVWSADDDEGADDDAEAGLEQP
jgi:putative transposase